MRTYSYCCFRPFPPSGNLCGFSPCVRNAGETNLTWSGGTRAHTRAVLDNNKNNNPRSALFEVNDILPMRCPYYYHTPVRHTRRNRDTRDNEAIACLLYGESSISRRGTGYTRTGRLEITRLGAGRVLFPVENSNVNNCSKSIPNDVWRRSFSTFLNYNGIPVINISINFVKTAASFAAVFRNFIKYYGVFRKTTRFNTSSLCYLKTW